ncbi:MAG: hypothetical protein IKD68_14335 [Solobacterium sp.]|nr:hypothetical protein [Solobacterium sp.]
MQKEYYRSREDWSDPLVLKKTFHKYFIDSLRKSPMTTRLTERLDRTSAIMNRRMDTALKTVKEARENVKDVYPDFPGVTSFERDWAYLNAMAVDGYDLLEEKYSILMGAAYWILDHVSRNRKMYELENTLLSEIPLWDWDDDPIVKAEDFTVSYEHVSSVIHILIHRNDDCRVYRKKNEPMKRVILDEATVKAKQHQDCPSRKRWETLLSFVDQQSIDEAVTLYRESFWQLARIFFSSLKENYETQDRLVRNHDRLIDREDEMVRELGGIKRIEKDLREFTVGFSMHDLNRERVNESMKRLRGIGEEIDRVSMRLDEMKRAERIFADAAIDYFELPQSVNDDFCPKEFCEAMKSFRIRDPYAICFAILYLIDHDDELPWLYYFSVMTVKYAVAFLPWAHDDYDFLDEGWEWEEMEESEPMDNLIPELNDIRYESYDEDIEFRTPYTLEQLLYRYTGVTMPRYAADAEHAADIMRDYGLCEAEEPWARILLRCFDAVKYRRTMDYYEAVQYAGKKEEEKAEELNQEDVLRRYSELKKENKTLRDQLYRALKDVRIQKETLEAYKKEKQSEENELHQLREYLFANMQEEEQEEKRARITLPVHVSKRIVVVGGHDSWLKQFREMLEGDVKYTGRGKINDALIQNCEGVWIQPNAISHSEYYKVTDLCRRNAIPFWYFRYASARKCAEQIAEEMKEKKR